MRTPVAHPGSAIANTNIIVTPEQHATIIKAKAAAAIGIRPDAERIRRVDDERIADDIAKRDKVPFVKALDRVRLRHDGILHPSLTVQCDNPELGIVTVQQIMDRPDVFEGETMADPIEGIAYGAGKAMVMRASSTEVIIHSFAHGGATYLGRETAEEAFKNTRMEPPPTEPPSSSSDDGPSFFDPSEISPPLPLPRGILAEWMEILVWSVAERDGIDPAVLAFAYLAAASGCANKNARFIPYAVMRYGEAAAGRFVPGELFDSPPGEALWSVPPLIWVMIIAMSGAKKTRPGDLAFRVLRQHRDAAARKYAKELEYYNSLPKQQQAFGFKPTPPIKLMIEDVSIERMQNDLARSNRGAIYYSDEFSQILRFGRYNSDEGAVRAKLLEYYEGNSGDVGRVSREAYMSCAALSMYGTIQRAVLAPIQGLDQDGMIQRINMVLAQEDLPPSRPDVIADTSPIDVKLEGLLHQESMNYVTTLDGARLIHDIEEYGNTLRKITYYGIGWQGAAGKLHGTLCRYILILHLLDDPNTTLIPTATVERGIRLLRSFLLPQMLDFYENGVRTVHYTSMSVADWILSRPGKTRIIQSDLTKFVRACQGLSTKELGEAMDPLVTWGWVEPGSSYLLNRVWNVHPELWNHFGKLSDEERARRKEWRKLHMTIKAGPEKPDRIGASEPDNPDSSDRPRHTPTFPYSTTSL